MSILCYVYGTSCGENAASCLDDLLSKVCSVLLDDPLVICCVL